MTALKLRPGTPEHARALYRAACEYQNGLSLETSARKHRVNPMTLRSYMKRTGWVIHKDRRYPGKTKTRPIPDKLLDQYPRLTIRQIADACGVSKTTVRDRLIARGDYKPSRQGAQPATRWANSLRNRENVLEAVELAKRGLSGGQIGVKLGVSKATVNGWLRRYRREEFLWQRERVPSWWAEPE
jgi:lambda repressor-like predicted transcriptional regulator